MMTQRLLVNPTAVITESMEKTISSRTIWVMTEAKAPLQLSGGGLLFLFKFDRVMDFPDGLVKQE